MMDGQVVTYIDLKRRGVEHLGYLYCLFVFDKMFVDTRFSLELFYD